MVSSSLSTCMPRAFIARLRAQPVAWQCVEAQQGHSAPCRTQRHVAPLWLVRDCGWSHNRNTRGTAACKTQTHVAALWLVHSQCVQSQQGQTAPCKTQRHVAPLWWCMTVCGNPRAPWRLGRRFEVEGEWGRHKWGGREGDWCD